MAARPPDVMVEGASPSPTVQPPRRGRLHVYLGSAPGVGTTYRMLEEGLRRAGRGTDVVVGVVDTHGRSGTARLLAGLETGGADLDVAALLRRRPAVALVDEMAHVNGPDARHHARWQDIDELLTAGIDVVTTLDIQHLESLRDSLARITGAEPAETIPDEVVRRADQVELVDMAPEALRRRIVHGNVCPTDDVDAALGGYFRSGNLSALRELALLWVADRVDAELLEYRAEQGIRGPWETRERIVVAITGAPSAEALVRRAARLAERSRAELLGVHVRRVGEVPSGDADRVLGEHRQLLADLGGRYHEVVGDDVASQLVAFARAENATQLVLGTSHRRRVSEVLRASVVNGAVNASPDIDVHVVAHGEHPPPRPRVVHRRRRWTAQRIPVRRRVAAWSIAGPPLLTLAFVPFREDDGLPGVLPAYLLLVVATALVGGTIPALVASVLGFTIGNLALTQPHGTFRITELASVVALVSFLAIALSVALVVGRLGARTAEAERARAQARALSSAAASLADDDAVTGLLDKLRTVLGLDAVVVVDEHGDAIGSAGAVEAIDADRADHFAIAGGGALVVSPAIADAEDRMIVRAFVDQLAAALRRSELARAEVRARTLAEIDGFRTALLRSVSHDLRTPLASIKAAASSLQQDDIVWPRAAHDEFVSTIVEEGDRLDRIVANLLDASRLEAGVLAVSPGPVDLDELVASVVRSIHPAGPVVVDVPDDLPMVAADRALLERVVENVLANSARHAPGPVEIRATSDPRTSTVSLRVVDHGPGVPAEARSMMFEGFQRLDDRGAGVGLGLAVAQGFVGVMGGVLRPLDTPGGGLTMEIVLPMSGVPR